MANIQLLLEAERRGLLPPDKKALLDEARRRGMLGAVSAEPEERTIGGYAKEALKGLIPGAVGLGETALTGAAALLPEEAEEAVRRPVEEFAAGVREKFAPAPGYEDTTVRELSELVGSTVPFLPLGVLGAAGRVAARGLGVAAGAGESRQRAEQEEATEGERGVATALGIIPGMLEASPPIRILRRFGFADEAIQEVAGLAPALKRIAKAGGEEALQEASSQVLQNLIAKGVYKPEEAVLGGVGEAAALGGGAGAVIGAIADLALGRRLRGAQPPSEQQKEPPTTEPTVSEIEAAEEVPLSPEAAKKLEKDIAAAYAEGDKERKAVDVERRAKELRFLAMQDDRLREAIEQQEKDEASKDDLEYLAQYDAALRARDEARRRPIGEKDQMGLPLVGGQAQLDLLAPTEVGEAIPGMYRPAEEALTGLKPRSRAYKEEAKDLGLRLDKKGNLKPNQFVPEITAQVSPDQGRFEFESQQQLPLTLPPSFEGQGDLFSQEPIPSGPTVPFTREAPVAETPVTEIPKEQYALDLPGIPMERLVPRDRVLRAMSITEDKKNIPNLQFATQLRPMELQRTLGDLKKEGAIAFNKKANEWELTPEGTEYVRAPRKKIRSASVGRRAAVSVPPAGTETPTSVGTAKRGMAGVGAPPSVSDVGEREGEPALTKPDRISERIIFSNAGSDFVKDLYSANPVDAILTNFEDLNTVTPEEINQSREYIRNISQNALRNEFGDEVTLYRGLKGTEERSPVLSYTLDKNVAKFQAEQQGIRTGKIEEIKVPVSKVLSYSEAIGRGTFAEAEVIISNPAYRMEAIRRAQEKRIAKEVVDPVAELRTQAIDAFDNDQINEKTYLAITDELKKPAPNLARATSLLEGTAKPKREKDVGLKFQLSPTAELPSAPHPEWATKFEPDVGGEVVYSDEDAALVRGSSVLSGQNVYMAVDRKTGMRTRVDIDSFTGKLFTPEQKQKLVDAKKEVVARDTKLFNQNPEGPFSNARTNVVTSENVNPNYGNYLSNLMKSMGLGDIRVFLIHPEDVRNQAAKYKLHGQYSSAMSAGLDAGEEGSIRTFGPNRKDFYISMKPGLSEGRNIEIIGHELGHLIERVAYNNASVETKAAIRAEYDAWLKDTKGKQGADLVRALRNRETAEAQAEGMTADTKLRDSYWRSFSEWFADNTSKWVTTSEKPVGIVEQFFADLAKKLRDFVAAITGNRFVPAKTVKKFLDDMGPGSADSWITERSKSDVTAAGMYDPFDDAARYSMTPTEQRAKDRSFIKAVGTIPQTLPAITKDTYTNAVDAASKMPSSMRQGLYSMLNLHELDRMYGKYTKALGDWWTDVNREGVALRKQQEVIQNNFQKWQKVMAPYSDAERDRIYKIFMDTTVDQVEVLDLVDPNKNINWVAKKDSPLYRQFLNLKPEVKEFYKELRLSYLDYSLQMEKLLQQYMTPNEWQKMLNEFNKRRLPVYLPLFRKGEYKLTYTDKDGEYVARQFETPNQRKLARLEAQRNGAKDFSESTLGAKEADVLPSAGFFGKVVGTLTKAGVDKDVVRSIVDTYLDYLPSNSVLQLARRREGTAGFSSNVLEAYANVADSYSRRLINMEFMPKFAAHNENFKADIMSAVDQGKLDSVVAGDLASITDRQLDYIRNPNLNNFAAKVGYFSYQMYLGANISTAIVNTFDIPTITWSRLGGKYGFGKAFNSISKATTTFFSKQKSPEMQTLIEQGLNSGVLREQQLQDLAEFKDMGSKYLQMKGRVERLTNWAFAKSDMFNRQVTLAAAYDLAKKTPEGVFDEKAFEQAQRAVYDVYGSSFPKAGPPIMGNQLARTALTFKRFAITRINLLIRAMQEAKDIEPDPEVRKAARKELLGYFGTAYVFAGIQGMPLVGAGLVLSSALNGIFGDDDEPYDPEFELRDAVNLFNYKGPVNYLLGVDIASRTGWTGMFWREDPKRMAEVGPLTYAVEQALGPAYSYASNIFKKDGALDLINEGQYGRGFEQLLPRVISNGMKAVRYAEEGALTAKGKPLVADVSAYNSFMQLFGFRPSDVAESGDIAGAAKRAEGVILERRNAIIARAALARLSGDMEGFNEARQEAMAYNRKNPEYPITADTIISAIERRKKSLLQSVNGVNVNPRLARKIYGDLGVEEELEE